MPLINQDFAERCQIFVELSKTHNLNKIKHNATLKDVWPDYPNEKMLDWTIGCFLKNVRSGFYPQYHDLLTDLGLTFYKERIIGRTVYICQAIDDLVKNGINLNDIPKDAMMSDYLPQYVNDDFCIGTTLSNARYGRLCKTVESKLKSYNFNFNTALLNRREEIFTALRAVSKITDLNKIKVGDKIKDYIPDYPGEMADWNIGIFIQNLRASESEHYKEFMTSLGYSFEKLVDRKSTSLIYKAFDDLVKLGIDLNEIPTKAKASDYIPSYAIEDVDVGRILKDARFKKTGKTINTKLLELGFDFKERTMPKTQEMTHILYLISKNVDINKIKLNDRVDDVLPSYNGRMKTWRVGLFLSNARAGKCPEWEQILKDFGFNLTKKNQVCSKEYLAKALEDLSNANIDINTIPERAKMSHYIPEYSKSDFNIGNFLCRARIQQISADLYTVLEKYNFDFNKKIIQISSEDKLKIVQILIDNGVDINTIKHNQTLSNFISLDKNQTDYNVGKWLTRARWGGGNKDFILGLSQMGYRFSKKSAYLQQFMEKNNLENL